MADKSILDGVPVDDKAFPLRQPPAETLEIVGACPTCGCPVYGKKHVRSDSRPVASPSCSCYAKANPEDKFAETIKTK